MDRKAAGLHRKDRPLVEVGSSLRPEPVRRPETEIEWKVDKSS